MTRRATERALAAERRLAAHEASTAWRITWPIRRLAHAVPPPVYRFVRGLPARLRDANAGGRSQADPALPDYAELRPTARSGPWALLIDDQWPRADRDAGSIEIMNMAAALIAFGFYVQFAISWGQPGAQPGDPEGGAALTALGVRCLGPEDASSLDAFLEQEGARFTLVVLNRVYCGGRFMEAVRSHCTGARVVFNTIDLHHLRLRREAELSGDAAGRANADATRRRKKGLAREADATIVVSEAEAAKLATAVPGAMVVVLPLARPVQPPRASFEARSGAGFIGGFAHAPNLDAIRAGMKGKVVSSLAAGVPCVATPMATEGMGRDLARYRDAMGLIVEDESIQGGAATFRGTRILVHQIADLLAQGVGEAELREDYPRLTPAMTAAAPVYARAHPRRGRPKAPAWRKDATASEVGKQRNTERRF